MAEPVRVLPCPSCRKPVRWSAANPHRPFCSKRCRLIDLGAWADETHRIPGDPVFDDPLPDDLDPE